MKADPQLGRFWKNRGKDGMRREQQLLVDFLCASAGGPLYYVGRDMKLSHEGMGIDESDWRIQRVCVVQAKRHIHSPRRRLDFVHAGAPHGHRHQIVRGFPNRSSASSSAAAQKLASLVFDSRHARTARLAQSMIATR